MFMKKPALCTKCDTPLSMSLFSCLVAPTAPMCAPVAACFVPFVWRSLMLRALCANIVAHRWLFLNNHTYYTLASNACLAPFYSFLSPNKKLARVLLVLNTELMKRQALITIAVTKSDVANSNNGKLCSVKNGKIFGKLNDKKK